MSRFVALPADYRPALAYWLRTANEGGELRHAAELRGTDRAVAPARRHCVALVHGYNTHAGEAAAAYLGFRRGQGERCGATALARLEARLGDVHWPGDAQWRGPLDWLDVLVYPYAVGMARRAASVLADALCDLPLERVDFVGHSLGCRVVLETVSLLYERGRARVGRICLMAAAVPCEMVEPGGRFDALVQRLCADGVRIAVLASAGDAVLRYAFPPGQALAGEPARRALGLHGTPPGMVGRGGHVSDVPIAGAGHGDYWGHTGTPASRHANRVAGEFLAPAPQPRTIAARPVGAVRAPARGRCIGA